MKKSGVIVLVMNLGCMSFLGFAMQGGQDPQDGVEMDVRSLRIVPHASGGNDRLSSLPHRVSDEYSGETRLEAVDVLERNERLRQENIQLRELIADHQQQRQKGITLTENELNELKRAQQQLQDLLAQQGSDQSNAKEAATAQGSFETETDIRCCNCGKFTTRCSCKGKTAAKFATVGGAGAAVGAVVATFGSCNIL